jgi:hypothetical protein
MDEGAAMKRNLPLMLLPLGIAATTTATAHHAFSAQFDADKPLSITGTVTKVEWRNPHTWFYIDVGAGDGTVMSWAVELASPNLLMRNGWSRDSMKVGDVVIVEGFHARDGTPTANAKSVVLAATGRTVLTGRSDNGSGR